MMVKTTYFGMIAERIGKEEETIELNVEGNTSLKSYFVQLYPELEEMSFQVAVNQEVSDTIPEGETVNEIALLPPFAGG